MLLNLCKTYFIIFFLYSVGLSAQNIIVDYSVRNENMHFLGQLKTYNNVSLYTVFFSKVKDTISYSGDEISSTTTRIQAKRDLHYLKDYNKGKIYYRSGIFNKNFFVEDSLNVFNWQIKSDTLTILGYKCQKAEVSFRGRNYTSYFTTKIKIPDGPWKFNGLPGLILKVVSQDGFYDLEATNIRLSNDTVLNKEEFLKEYKKDKPEINFTDFKNAKRKKMEEVYKKELSEFDETGGVVTKLTEMEIFYNYPHK